MVSTSRAARPRLDGGAVKRVLLLVVDGCTARVLGPMLHRQELPVVGRLVAAGSLDLTCVSIFPSITPAATTTIVTGRYPMDHGIAGMSWFDPSTGRLSYFGDDIWTIARRGFGEFLRGFLLRLNDDLLKAPTLFQIAERQGRSAACFNHLIFRGDVAHRVKMPWLLRLLPGVSSDVVVHGPSTLCLGNFVANRAHGPSPEADGGLFSRFGMDDDSTADFLMSFERASALPDFNVAYFADYDYQSHEKGPVRAADTLRHVDALLAKVFDAWGGIERVLEDACVILTADHSQSQVGDDDTTAIQLDELLGEWSIGNVTKGWTPQDQLILCPNMRAAEVYFQASASDAMEGVTARLVQDPRVDQVIWRDSAGPPHGFTVRTGDRGTLRFWSAAGGRLRDAYGGRWDCEGDLTALDTRIDGGGDLVFGAYPNAFERIAAGLSHERSGPLWVTARPGYEFELAGQDPHRGGGSHGTLHELDSLVPLLVAGAPVTLKVPGAPRLVDVEPLCRTVLGLTPDIPPGETHLSP